MSKKIYLGVVLLTLAASLNLACGGLNRANEPNEAETKAEKERNEIKARCSKEKDALSALDSKVDELGSLPKKLQLTPEPYIKGKLFVVDERDKRLFAYDFTSTGCRYSKECERDAGCTGVDPYRDVRARSIDEVQTVALISCRKVKKGDYTRTSGAKQGESVPGFDVNCEVSIADRTIPAVIYKKTFKSELLMLENETALDVGNTRELVARTPYREIDAFLVGLPRR